MRKLLLGTTAIVATSLFAGHAFAQGISFSGYVDFQVGGTVNDDGAANTPPVDGNFRKYDMVADTRLNIQADFVADNLRHGTDGLEYGAFLRLEDTFISQSTAVSTFDPTTGLTTTSNVESSNIDNNLAEDFAITKGYIYIGDASDATGWGQIRGGDDGTPTDDLVFNVVGVGSGEADGDFGRFLPEGVDYNGNFIYDTDDTKIKYQTPNFALGFGTNSFVTAEVSYSPTSSGDFSQNQNLGNCAPGSITAGDQCRLDGDLEDVLSGAVQANFGFGAFQVGVMGGIDWGDLENGVVPPAGAASELLEYGGSARVKTGGFTVSGYYVLTDRAPSVSQNDRDIWGVGATYSFGPWAVGANFIREKNGLDEIDWAAGAGVQYSLAPGMTPYVEYVHYRDEDTVAATATTPAFIDKDSYDVVLGGIEMAF